jgi:RNA recognition motif-containing protein
MPNAYQLGPGPVQANQMRQDSLNQEVDDELIPTAIVIKNIPFAVKKEQLIQLMTDLALPLPYAFNYHFDNGIFRGLAFANFTSADETAAVIDSLNHFELQGRKLRVEYKKMLPLQERERIEREKRERRGQLEEQHRPMAASQLQNQTSMSSLTSHLPTTSPSPVSQRPHKLGKFSSVTHSSGPCKADLYSGSSRGGHERSSDSVLLLPASVVPARCRS